jgi:hypothetical protein
MSINFILVPNYLITKTQILYNMSPSLSTGQENNL